MFIALSFIDKRGEQLHRMGHRVYIPLLFIVTTDEPVYLTVVWAYKHILTSVWETSISQKVNLCHEGMVANL
jgi:hypothetical protein